MGTFKIIWQLINKYDKISHFIGGFIFGILGLPFQPAMAIFVAKEVVDNHFRKSPFSSEDVVAGVGGWCLGNYIREIIMPLLAH